MYFVTFDLRGTAGWRACYWFGMAGLCHL